MDNFEEDTYEEESHYNPFNDNLPVEMKEYKSHVIDNKSLKFSCYEDYLMIKDLYHTLLSGAQYENRQLENEMYELEDVIRAWRDDYYYDYNKESFDMWYKYDRQFEEMMEEVNYNDNKISDFNHSLALIDAAWKKQKISLFK